MKAMHRSSLLLFVSTALSANAQTLLEAVSKIPELSNFTAFYTANELFADSLFNNQSLYPITVLVPNDNAFAAYESQHGVSLTEVPPETLLPLVQYHTLVSSLSKDNFTSDSGSGSGATIPTLMDDPKYNNRSVGTALAAKYGGPQRTKGQVVFIKPNGAGSTSKFLLSRQAGGSSAAIRSGLSSDVSLTALDDTEGTWDGGRFHIIDGILTPPDLCKTTIRSAGMTGLDNALNRSGLWSALDSAANVTCLGPSNDAFKSGGSPDQKLNETELAKALLFHTLPAVTYSDFLEDGMEFTSLQNMTVRVRVEGQGRDRQVWFNNAKVVDANVLTHNGLMHVLDAVMKPLDQTNATTSATPTPTLTPTSTSATTASGSAASPSGAAVPTQLNWMSWTLLGVLGVVVVMEGLGVGAVGGRLFLLS